MRIILVTLAGLLAPAVPAAAQAATPVPSPRIVNGHAPTQVWPAQASVTLKTATGTFVCGGTLVSARWVLTAGHCATDDAGAPAVAGAFGLNVGGTTRANGSPTTVDQTAQLAPGFTPQTETGAPAVVTPPTNDLALLHLDGALSQEPLHIVGTSAAENALWAAGTTATMIGWGVTEAGTQSPTLLQAETLVDTDGACSGVFGSAFSAASMFCAGGLGVDTCGGDSGGPIMVPGHGGFTLVGVTSWGADACGTRGVPGVYARLGTPALNSWVRSKVPTADIGAAPSAPAPGQQVTLGAGIGFGTHAATPAPVLSWDLDGDGAYDDATGTSASTAFADAGAHQIGLQAVFADGDRAVARENLTVAVPPPPPPPQATGPTPEQLAELRRLLALPIGSFAVPARVKLNTLRTKSLRVRFSCRLACSITGRLSIDRATARRYGLSTGARQVTIGSGKATRKTTGKSTMTVRLTARAKRRLRNRTRFTMRVATTLTGKGAATVTKTRRVTVLR